VSRLRADFFAVRVLDGVRDDFLADVLRGGLPGFFRFAITFSQYFDAKNDRPTTGGRLVGTLKILPQNAINRPAVNSGTFTQASSVAFKILRN
jgi:hypothetical protein